MTPVPGDEELERILQQAQPYLDDAGFTQRVLTALPPRRASGRARAVVLAGSTVAALLVFALGPVRSLWGDALAALSTGAPAWPSAALALLCAVVLGATALSALLRESEG